MRHDAVTDRAIRDWVGAREVQKGHQYANTEDILDPVAQGDTLKARIQGTADRPYRLWVRVAGGRVQDADCSCPVGDGGRCKHVAALLMTFRDDPDAFTEVEETDANLQARDKAELIALIKLMLRKAPELESLLTAPVPGGKKSKAPPSPEVYRKQAMAVLRQIPEWEEWGGEAAEEELGEIVRTGEEFEAAGDHATAAAAFQGVADAALDAGRDLLGEANEGSVTGRLVAGLLRQLNREPAGSPRRESLMRSAFDLIAGFFSWAEGDEFDPLAELLRTVTEAERRTLGGWARQLKPAVDRYAGEYDRERFTRLQIRIDADVMGDDELLKTYRGAGMTFEVVGKLLELGRTVEAVREVETAVKSDRNHRAIEFANLLVKHRQGDAAERIVRGLAAKKDDWGRYGLLDWLRQRAAQRGDKAEALRLLNEQFEANPHLELYRKLRDQTAKADWPDRRQAILTTLRQGRWSWLVIDILLDEKDVEAVLAEYQRKAVPDRALDVAKAAEATHPAEAIAIYRKHAERSIEGRNRTAYQEACKQLKKVRDLMGRQGEAAAFQTYIAGLLDKYRSLRAFHDEVKKAKLVQEVPPTAVRRKG